MTSAGIFPVSGNDNFLCEIARFVHNDNLPIEIAAAPAVFPSADALPKSTWAIRDVD
jgi:hypothetical protein